MLNKKRVETSRRRFHPFCAGLLPRVQPKMTWKSHQKLIKHHTGGTQEGMILIGRNDNAFVHYSYKTLIVIIAGHCVDFDKVYYVVCEVMSHPRLSVVKQLCNKEPLIVPANILTHNNSFLLGYGNLLRACAHS